MIPTFLRFKSYINYCWRVDRHPSQPSGADAAFLVTLRLGCSSIWWKNLMMTVVAAELISGARLGVASVEIPE